MQNITSKFAGMLLIGAALVLGLHPLAAQDISQPWSQETWESSAEITVLEESDGRVFAGTAKSGLFYSDDSGDNWISLRPGLPLRTIHSWTKIANTIIVTGAAGAFRSEDNGTSWETSEIAPGVALTSAWDVAQHETSIFAARLDAIFQSDDQGKSWQQVEFESEQDNELSNIYKIESHDGRLYLGNNSNLYRLDVRTNELQPIGTPFWSGAIHLIKNVREQLFTSGRFNDLTEVNLYRLNSSTDTWVPSTVGDFGDNTVNDIISSGDRSYVATDRGVFESTDAGNWSSIHTRENRLRANRITLSGAFLLIGTASHGVSRYNIDAPAEGLVEVNKGLNSWAPTRVWQFSERLYVQSPSHTLLSKTRGTSEEWQEVIINNSLSRAMDMVQFKDELLYLSLNLYTSADEGRTWQPRSSKRAQGPNRLLVTEDEIYGFSTASTYRFTTPTNVSRAGFPNAQNFVALATQDNFIFGSRRDGRVLRSDDHGKNWQDVSTGLPDELIYTMWANSDVILGATAFKLYQSRNSGQTWQDVDIQDLSADTRILQISENNGTVYVLKVDGIWFADVNELAWTKLSLEGVPDYAQLNSMSVRGDQIYITTNGSGVFTTTLDLRISSVSDEPKDILELTISPNPVLQTSTVSFTLAQAATVEISVFDAQGKQVLPSTQSFQPAGSSAQNLKLTGLSSGQYTLVLRSGAETTTQQFAVVK